MRVITAVLVSAAFGAGAIGTVVRSNAAQATVGSFSHDERHRAGPDSGRVALLFAALEKTDPIVCDLITDQLGNFWWGDGHAGLGRYADRPATLDAAKDSVGSPVSDPRAILRLVGELSNPNYCARRLAGKMLGNSAVAGSRIAALFASSDVAVREGALYATGNRDTNDLRAAIEKMLDDREPRVAAMAAWALGQHEDDHAAIPALIRAARASDTHVRAAAVWALGRMHDEEGQAKVLPTVRDALGDRDVTVRRVAVSAYGDFEEIREAPAALVSAMNAGDAELRYLAARTVAHIADPATTKQIIALSTDPDRDLRKEAVEALGKIGSSEAVGALTRALGDKDREVRKAAAEALGELKER
jgi:HEAT repeat protein